MKSLKNRVNRIESKTMKQREDVPDNLPDIYDKEDNPKTEMHKAMDALYNPNRGCRNPNEAIQ